MPEPTEAIPQGGNTPDVEELETQSIGSDAAGAVALDALLKEVTGGDTETDTEADKAKAEAEAKAKAEAEAKAKADAEAAAPDPDKVKAEAEAKAKADADAAAKASRPKEEFEKIELGQHVKPKTAEAFATVKTLARERVDKLETELASTRTQAEELRKQVETAKKTAIAPEVEKELKELREFRSKVDVDADPKFKEFDAQITENVDAIYKKLKEAGVDDTFIAKVKEMGGPAEVDWEPLVSKLPGSLRRFLDAKLVENEDLGTKKQKALDAAKANASEYLKGREQQFSQSTESQQQHTQAALNDFLPKLTWFAKKDAAAAKPEEKAAVEAHNKFVDETTSEVDEMLKDGSPQMRAVMIAGYVQLKHERREKAAADAANKAEVEKLTKERDEAKTMLDRIKKSSTPRLRESNAPGAGEKTAARKIDLKTPTTDVLDNLRDQVLAAQE